MSSVEENECEQLQFYIEVALNDPAMPYGYVTELLEELTDLRWVPPVRPIDSTISKKLYSHNPLIEEIMHESIVFRM